MGWMVIYRLHHQLPPKRCNLFKEIFLRQIRKKPKSTIKLLQVTSSRRLVKICHFLITRSFEFKPRKIDDDVTRRFALMTSSHRYEMLTGEPRIGLNGVWRQEVEKVKSFGEKLVKEKNGAGDFEMIDLFRHDDAFAGIHYVITFQNKNENQISVELKRSFVEKPELKKVGIEANKEKVVNVIMPLSKVSDRFLMFLDRLQNSILSDVNANIRLIFIVFQQSRDDDVIDIIQKFQKKNPNSKILTKILQQKFNRAVGLATGSQLVSDDVI